MQIGALLPYKQKDENNVDKKKFLVIAVYVGIQSFLLQLVDQLIGKCLVSGGTKGFVFIAFQAWALYCLLGNSLKGAVKGICGYILGIIFAVIMSAGAGMFSWMGILAVPVTALIVVPFMMYFEFAPWCISNVAVFFVGAGAYYGILNYVDGINAVRAAGIVMLYCVLGLASGFMTILFRTQYERKITGMKAKEEKK